MKRVKYAVWALGLVSLLALAHYQGFGNGSAYIQFIDGAILAYGAGEYIEKRAHIKQFFENHRRMHEKVDRLHEQLGKEDNDGKDD